MFKATSENATGPAAARYIYVPDEDAKEPRLPA
jgi:hypothetical protein